MGAFDRLVQALKALFLYISSLDLIDGYGTPASWIVMSYEIAFVVEINTFTRRAKVNVLCALPAKEKTTMGNESSTSYMSRQMYEIASLIDNYLWLKPGTSVYEESDRISSDLDTVTFNLNSRNPTSKTTGIIQMAATLSFSTSTPLHYYTELSIAVSVRSIPSQFLNISHDDKSHNEAQITGFWIDLLKEAIAVMPINTTYKLVPFYGSDDQLFETLARRTFAAAIGPWLVLILVVSSTYTQSFTSMITTSSDIESSSCSDIENLKKANAIVGCDMEDSIMLQHLVEVIGFRRNNIKYIAQSSIDDYAKALSTGNINAAFFWAPYSSLFLAKYCKGFKSWCTNYSNPWIL